MAPVDAPQVRPLRPADLPQVLDNEDAAYEFPWSSGIFEDCLKMGYPAWVAEDAAGQIMGHAVLTMAVGEAHVLNLGVHPQHQRQGVGRALLRTLLEHARQESAIRMFLEVRASNAAARALYQAHGFEEVGLRKGYYPLASGREDAVVLRLDF